MIDDPITNAVDSQIEKLNLRQLDQTAERIFRHLIKGVKVGGAKQIGEKGGPFMAVHIDRLHQRLYAIAHYFEQSRTSLETRVLPS